MNGNGCKACKDATVFGRIRQRRINGRAMLHAAYFTELSASMWIKEGRRYNETNTDRLNCVCCCMNEVDGSSVISVVCSSRTSAAAAADRNDFYPPT